MATCSPPYAAALKPQRDFDFRQTVATQSSRRHYQYAILFFIGFFLSSFVAILKTTKTPLGFFLRRGERQSNFLRRHYPDQV
jgi:hypothetical protein